MKVLVISDIHANLTALDAVLADAAGQWDEIWCLGDVVGYGPDPNECVTKLREIATITLIGNHDWAALGKLSIEQFNPAAQQAALWTGATITSESRSWLDSQSPSHPLEQFMLAHGSPLQPIWEYIINTIVARDNFTAFEQPFCLVGHSHYPAIFIEESDQVNLMYANYDHVLQLDPAVRMILNPGSVGQPRDGDPRAAYALLDTDQLTWAFKRVSYDIAQVQERMRDADLPESLVNRIALGM